MKKITLSLTMAALAIASCQKPETDITVSEKESFKASVESFTTPTKTSMTEEKTVVWSEDDRLAIFQGSALADEFEISDASVGKSSATFTKVTTSGEDYNAGTELPCNVALYPYAEGLTLTGASFEDEGTAYAIEGVVLPAEQTYAEGSFANGSFPMAAVTDDLPDHNLKFKNVLGALKLQLKGTQTVKSIKLTGKNDEILSGAATVTAYANNLTPTITMEESDDAAKSVTLDCGNGVQLTSSAVTDFIIALPPTVFESGFTVTVTYSDGVEDVIETGKENEVKRSTLLTMPEVDLGGESSGNTNVDYVDEYGVNHGPGIEIDGVVWAPVNCGYKAATATDKGYPYGKLYQWGRKYGQGYNGDLYDLNSSVVGEITDATYPSGDNFVEGPVETAWGSNETYADKFFTILSDQLDWSQNPVNDLWAGENGAKTSSDPCPDGWRVPTSDELRDLTANYSQWTTNADGQTGYYFSGDYTYIDGVSCVFFPAAGFRYSNDLAGGRGSHGVYYSSSTLITYAGNLLFYSGSVNMGYDSIRARGYSVRCVQASSAAESLPSVEISVEKDAMTMYPSAEYQLNVSVESDAYDETDITWTSDSPSVATVSASGVIVTVSDGTAVITASIGNTTASCTVTVKSATSTTAIDYVVGNTNYGTGIKIGQTIWAPVNCGYEPASGDYKGYPYGKLYQWGRKYGQGFSGSLYDIEENRIGQISDANYPSDDNMVECSVETICGSNETYADKFFTVSSSSYDWSLNQVDDLWLDDNGAKTENDPCPDGWRVPTYDELSDLSENYSQRTTNAEGQVGYYFSGDYTYMDGVSQIFFPAAGRRYYSGYAGSRGPGGFYWSSSTKDTYAYYLQFGSDYVFVGFDGRAYGYSVRCVQVIDEVAEL